MGEFSYDRSRLVAETANRLRLMQVDFAQEEPSTREEYLSGELKVALERVPLAEQHAFLKELGDRFPTWEAAPPPPPEPPAPPPPPARPDLPTALKMVAEDGRGLPESQRQEVINRLMAAWGLSQKAAPAAPVKTEAVAANIGAKLGLSANQQVDPTRVAELTVLLIDFVQKLQPLTNKAWSMFKTEADAIGVQQKTMARFVSGDAAAPLNKELTDLRQTIAAFMDALSKCGRTLYHRHLLRLDPEDVKAAIVAERGRVGGFLRGADAECWEKYCELAVETLGETNIQSAMSKIVVEAVERTRGAAKGAGAD